ncbi:DUF1385 domain-containing protein [Egicoccus halophilus]|uniref:Membrane protein n=1 Tax=Egicoccus halophilus TaxID=1670830 RepID=A0A8J3ESX4_9ACTN|nr:DUF1385 domain-containing protein [Egicoccus halophilus]GGI04007.1 membrane protein [Egicoccus halophilus]
MSSDVSPLRPEPLAAAPHYYGGQAVIEGVMMRGADRWAVAVRRPAGDIWLECHAVSDLPQRRPILGKPLVRGCYALADSLAVGMRALGISATQAFDDEDGEEELGGGAIGASLLVALLLFVGIFIFLPSAGTKAVDALVGGHLGDGVWFHLVESFVRIVIFLGYLWSISLLADIRRVFQYHGAEHKTIAAWEHGETLEPETVDRYSTLHVRCGTNFLIMVMLLAVVIYTLAGVLVPPPEGAGLLVSILYHVALRVVLLPVVAGLAYEGLRLGAAKGEHPLVRALMQPGLWLQRITTKPPTRDQIEVAIRSFEAVVPAELREGRVPHTLDSPVVLARDGLPVTLSDADVRVDGAPAVTPDRGTDPADAPFDEG